MTNIVDLPPAEDPPGHGPWAMVVIGQEYPDLKTKNHTLGRTFMGPPDMEAEMMRLAGAFAEETQAGYIFVRRSGENAIGHG